VNENLEKLYSKKDTPQNKRRKKEDKREKRRMI
jgi:hypothetical protein